MLAALLLVLAPAAAEQPSWFHPGRGWFTLGAHLHYGWVPGGLVGLLYAEHGRVWGIAPGAELGWAKEGFRLTAKVSPLIVGTPASAWLEHGQEIDGAVWVEQDLVFTATKVSMGYAFPVGRRPLVQPSIGWGYLWTGGALVEYPTDGGDQIDQREKIEGSSGEQRWIPSRLRGSELQLRVGWRLTPRRIVAVDLGYTTYLYAGLALEWGLLGH